MRITDTIKAGDEIFTKDGTMLRFVKASEVSAVFEEYEYNDESEIYDIMIDSFRHLFRAEIENIMHDYDGKNHYIELVQSQI